MGVDIVAIGLKHTLPINDPVSIAERLSPLFNTPIMIGYYNEWKYDAETELISRPDDYKWETLSILNHDRESEPAKLIIKNKSAEDIYLALNKKITIDNFNNASEYEWFMEDLSKPYSLYELESADERQGIRIFKDIFEFDINSYLRWFPFTDLFKDCSPENIQLVKQIRDCIHWQCELVGCKQIYMFPDQDYGESLYNEINRTSQEWLKLMNNIVEEKLKEYDDNLSKGVFNINDYLNHQKILPQTAGVFCFFDEFPGK
ncbi:MAG: hypothetical protein J1E97_07045 [Muribaculaceae bacterium]|nr:hypothetical protein [Muribaculaceae bacterium]